MGMRESYAYNSKYIIPLWVLFISLLIAGLTAVFFAFLDLSRSESSLGYLLCLLLSSIMLYFTLAFTSYLLKISFNKKYYSIDLANHTAQIPCYLTFNPTYWFGPAMIKLHLNDITELNEEIFSGELIGFFIVTNELNYFISRKYFINDSDFDSFKKIISNYLLKN